MESYKFVCFVSSLADEETVFYCPKIHTDYVLGLVCPIPPVGYLGCGEPYFAPYRVKVNAQINVNIRC